MTPPPEAREAAVCANPVCRCGHHAGSHSSLRHNCMATTDGTHATRCDCRQYAAAPVPPATCGACGHLHATAEQDGVVSVFHRCRMRGCSCNEFQPARAAPPPAAPPEPEITTDSMSRWVARQCEKVMADAPIAAAPSGAREETARRTSAPATLVDASCRFTPVELMVLDFEEFAAGAVPEVVMSRLPTFLASLRAALRGTP